MAHRFAVPAASLLAASLMLICPTARGAQGRITIPLITGRPGVQAFAGHAGWVDGYTRNKPFAVSTRIKPDGTFSLPDSPSPLNLIITFDKMQVPPFAVPDWTAGQDVPLPVEYACVPPGYPRQWQQDYQQRFHHYYQTFVPRCTQITGLLAFDGPKVVAWGNKINAVLHQDGPTGKPMWLLNHNGERSIDFLSGPHSDFDSPRVGWRHGDLPVTPGKTYAMCVGGYNSHGGEQLDLITFVRPDRGDGYAQGDAHTQKNHSAAIVPAGGDLCCVIFGNGNGQIVENQLRTEEWEIFIPSLHPTKIWGQTFVNHGRSLAGIAVWASNGSDTNYACEIRIRKDGPTGELIRPVKTPLSHASPLRPIIRYTDWPRPLEGLERYYKLPADLFQASYAPGELPLEPGRTYFIELTFTEPVLCYVDGDFYDAGYAYYEDLKMERARPDRTKHSDRWTLLTNIVTYEHERMP